MPHPQSLRGLKKTQIRQVEHKLSCMWSFFFSPLQHLSLVWDNDLILCRLCPAGSVITASIPGWWPIRTNKVVMLSLQNTPHVLHCTLFFLSKNLFYHLMNAQSYQTDIVTVEFCQWSVWDFCRGKKKHYCIFCFMSKQDWTILLDWSLIIAWLISFQLIDWCKSDPISHRLIPNASVLCHNYLAQERLEFGDYVNVTTSLSRCS